MQMESTPRRVSPRAMAGSSSTVMREGRAGVRSERETQMDWNIIEGKWKELKGHAREQWGKLTDDELEEIGGKKDRLVGKLQQKYGYSVMGVVLGLHVHFD